MIYTVTYFNPLGNCDNVTHVEADNEVDAALIAHADFWATPKPFSLSDYNVSEYSPEYVVKKEDIFEKGKKRDGGWTEEVFDLHIKDKQRTQCSAHYNIFGAMDIIPTCNVCGSRCPLTSEKLKRAQHAN